MECSSPPAGCNAPFQQGDEMEIMVKNDSAINCRSVTRNLPTFLGIGSMRCGSTWLYKVLRRHPDVQLASCKEMDFFFMHKMLRHDLAWYETHFKTADDTTPKPVQVVPEHLVHEEEIH